MMYANTAESFIKNITEGRIANSVSCFDLAKFKFNLIN